MTPFDFFHIQSDVFDLPKIDKGAITYTPPFVVLSEVLPVGDRFLGTIATYSCSPGYKTGGRIITESLWFWWDLEWNNTIL